MSQQLERLLQEHLWEPAKISELIANLEAYRDADGHISLEGLADPVLRYGSESRAPSLSAAYTAGTPSGE